MLECFGLYIPQHFLKIFHNTFFNRRDLCPLRHPLKIAYACTGLCACVLQYYVRPLTWMLEYCQLKYVIEMDSAISAFSLM